MFQKTTFLTPEVPFEGQPINHLDGLFHHCITLPLVLICRSSGRTWHELQYSAFITTKGGVGRGGVGGQARSIFQAISHNLNSDQLPAYQSESRLAIPLLVNLKWNVCVLDLKPPEYVKFAWRLPHNALSLTLTHRLTVTAFLASRPLYLSTHNN